MIPQSPASLNNPGATQPTAPTGQQNLLQALIQRWLTSQGPNGSAPGSPYAQSLGQGAPTPPPGPQGPPGVSRFMNPASGPVATPPPAPPAPPMGPPRQSRFMNPGPGAPPSPVSGPGAGAPPMGDINLPAPPPAPPSAPMGPPSPPPVMGPPSSPQNDAQALGSPQSQGDIDPMLFNKTGVEDQSSQDQLPLDSQPIGGTSPLEQALVGQQMGQPSRGPMTQISHHGSGHGLGRIFKAIVGR